MKKQILTIAIILISISSEAKLIDKIAGIVDDNVITLSQLQRMSKSLPLKKNIAPNIYDKTAYTNEEFLNLSVNKYLIRAKLNELGIPVGDDVVDGQVKANEKRLNVDRDQLKTFLKTQNTSFDEYFETLREAIEYSYFVGRVITPMISVSEQEVKNEFIKRNSKDARLNIKYQLIDYSITKEAKPKLDKNEFLSIIKGYRQSGVLPESFSTMTSTNLDDVTEEGLANDLKLALKNTDEGALSNMIFLNGQNHIFYIVKKDLVETETYAKQKAQIKDELFENQIKVESGLWFEREKNKHYIKIAL